MVNNINYEVEYVMNGIIQVDEVEAEVNNLCMRSANSTHITKKLHFHFHAESLQNIYLGCCSAVAE